MSSFQYLTLNVVVERVTSMLPSEKKQLGLGMIPRREPFEVLYRLNCDNLCADFSEDIEFRFSFGITSMIQRFTGKGKISPWVISNYTESVIFAITFAFCFSGLYYLIIFRFHVQWEVIMANPGS